MSRTVTANGGRSCSGRAPACVTVAGGVGGQGRARRRGRPAVALSGGSGRAGRRPGRVREPPEPWHGQPRTWRRGRGRRGRCHGTSHGDRDSESRAAAGVTVGPRRRRPAALRWTRTRSLSPASHDSADSDSEAEPERHGGGHCLTRTVAQTAAESSGSVPGHTAAAGGPSEPEDSQR
jgi:hypothetical protein